MDSIDDSKPVVPHGFNIDTIMRYASRAAYSPLASYLIVNALSRRLKTATAKDKLSAAAALWAAANVVVPGVGKLAGRLFYGGKKAVQWQSEIVVVTGGSNGVGLELVKRLLKAGARVAILDVHAFPIDDARYNDQWKYYSCDITNLEQVKEVAGQIRADLGDATMLVNNAGIVVGKLLLDMSDREVDKVVDVNLTSQFHLIRQFLPAMLKAKRGHIVSIGSIVSFVGTPQASTYCATKGAVRILHESLRREVASRYEANSIQFTIAFPGVINTGLFGGLDLGSFLFPTLRPDSIARKVFAALGSGKGEEIFLPTMANLLPIINTLPLGVQSTICDVLGGNNNAMSSFSGHTKY
ncbi:hypothetical protein H4R26_006022 [Coemansia thaxteri]|uniref:Short-chain dehydrogenase/reductase 3 n=1 Tax=Coemansia thaxteri TaxID=2663907 RepID=A0A9W8EC03_9FUNG|nr:hypothetical protein H4R26_006022 [Coemansia thaxteri]KAJ2480636.1 hypothetical protein EV174_003670 [Coemansia sp. RSA 2320]